MQAILALENGKIFKGKSLGNNSGYTVGEIIFNTAMAGYQEILTDPSYAKQLITFTYPHIGNTGITLEDYESNKIWASGIIIKEPATIASNYRSKQAFTKWINEQKIIGISKIDTRALTKIIREHGSLHACIMTGSNIKEAEAINYAQSFHGIQGLDLTDLVTTEKFYIFNPLQRETKYKVVVLDFGVKRSILKKLAELNCKIIVMPANTTIEEIMQTNPDGILLSNGPGDPSANKHIIKLTKILIESTIPLFGICLGQQILGIALGANIIKMKFGHHGANHPVKDILNNKVLITSQNHNFSVDESTLPAEIIVTHRSLFDGSLQGFKHQTKSIYGFQGHPEANPGPLDAAYIFDPFITAMMNKMNQNNLTLRKDRTNKRTINAKEN